MIKGFKKIFQKKMAIEMIMNTKIEEVTEEIEIMNTDKEEIEGRDNIEEEEIDLSSKKNITQISMDKWSVLWKIKGKDFMKEWK